MTEPKIPSTLSHHRWERVATDLYVTVFAKRDHLGANLNFEFCI